MWVGTGHMFVCPIHTHSSSGSGGLCLLLLCMYTMLSLLILHSAQLYRHKECKQPGRFRNGPPPLLLIGILVAAVSLPSAALCGLSCVYFAVYSMAQDMRRGGTSGRRRRCFPPLRSFPSTKKRDLDPHTHTQFVLTLLLRRGSLICPCEKCGL